MAAYNKFNIFPVDLLSGNHDFDAHTIKIMLTNSTPAATNTIKGNLTELATGAGYTQEHASLNVATISVNQTGAAGTGRVVPSGDNTVTATGALGPFQHVVVYNFTQSSPVKPLICWYDYGSAVTLANTETFTTDFDNTNSGGLFGLT